MISIILLIVLSALKSANLSREVDIIKKDVEKERNSKKILCESKLE